MGAFVGVMFLSGRIGGVLSAASSLRWLAGEFLTRDSQVQGAASTLSQRLMQYTHFVSSCFVAPSTVIESARHGYPTWQQAPVDGFHWLGLALLLGCALGFVLNRRERLAQLSAAWVLVSFGVLCVVGWGASENGMVLYTLYFGWAFFCLLVLGARRLTAGHPALGFGLRLGTLGALLACNLPALWRMLAFCFAHYPLP